MIEASEILSRPDVANAFRALIAAEMQRANIKMGVAAQVAGALSDRLLAGENVETATDVVAQIRAVLEEADELSMSRSEYDKRLKSARTVSRSNALNEAADIVDACRDDEVTDLRQVRDRIRSAE